MSIPAGGTRSVMLDEQKRYIKNHSYLLVMPDKIHIGQLLIAADKTDNLKWCSGGTIINLDRLSPQIIEEIYNFMMTKINNN